MKIIQVYKRMIWPRRAPMVFIMPIWFVCWFKTAARVLVIRKALRNITRKPSTTSTAEIACT